MKKHPAHGPLALALLALVAAGCTSVTPSIVSEPVPPPPVGDGTPVTIPEGPAYTVSEKAESMRIAIDVSAEDEASTAFASGVRETVVTALRGRKFQIVTDGSRDLDLSFSARQSLFDRTGEYVTLDGTVSARLDDAATGNVLAETSFHGRNKASLGDDRAAIDLSKAMRPAIREWIAATVTPEQVPLDVRTLRVSDIDRYPGGESAFIDGFVAAVSGMEGVLRCETVASDAKAHTATFRALYRPSQYPQGLVHAAILRHPEFNLVLK